MQNGSTPGELDSQYSIFASVISQSADPVITIDPEGIITSWNKSATEVFGLPAEVAIGSNIARIFSPEEIYQLKAILDCIATGENLVSLDVQLQHPVESVFIANMTVTSLRDARGDIFGASLIIRDVTRRKILENNLLHSEGNLRAIFENAQEGFVLINRDGTIVTFNDVARQSILLTHGPAPAKAGDSIFDHIEPGRKEEFAKIIARVLQGEQIQYDKLYRTANAESLWFSISLNAVKGGEEVMGISITGIDITTRKEAEARAEENQQFFRTIVENSGDAVSIFSSEGRQIYVSPSVKNILGFSEEEALSLELFSMIHPDDAEDVVKVWEDTLSRPGGTQSHIVRVLHKKGGYRTMENTVTNLLEDPVINGVVCNFRDISEKLETLKQLRTTKERYQYLFYNNPLPMWIFDQHTYQFLEINEAAIIKYGYTREEFLRMTIKDIRPDYAVERLIASMDRRARKKYNFSGTWEHRTKSGTILEVEVSSHPVQFDDREGILVLANDITEKKRATRMLLKVYQEKSTILESIGDGFLTVDKEWKVTYFNKMAERILQIPREQILSCNIWEVYSETVPLKFYSESHRAMEENIPLTYEEYFPPLKIWLDVNVYPSEEGLSIYFKDITEKKLIEERIKTAKERYEIVANATNQAVYEWDIINDTNYWSEGFNTIFGHPRLDGVMPVSTWLENIHPDELQDLMDVTTQAFTEKRTALSRELRFRCADGHYKTVLDNLVILYNENGEPVKIMGAMQDLTERMKSEQAVRELNDQLNRRAKELAESNEELERFAYVASHDLQEPLRMVSSFLQLLQRKYEKNLDATANQYIEFAVNGADRMKRLILDLLEYSRVGTNKDQLQEIDMNEVAAQVLKNFSNRINVKEAVVTIGALPIVHGHRTQLTQLIQNLVSNSLKYNISFVPEVRIGFEEEADAWRFYVHDNGIGIDAKFSEKVFVIFQRLHNREQFSGTGVGLAICKKIVEKHGGRIWVESEPGKGSTFYFTIKK